MAEPEPTELGRVDRSHYPELDRLSRTEIWRGVGPGGLYLVSRLARRLELRPGDWVLDLGCGAAESSLYLAERYGARVIAADLWTDPADNAVKIAARGCRDCVIPMRLNASRIKCGSCCCSICSTPVNSSCIPCSSLR